MGLPAFKDNDEVKIHAPSDRFHGCEGYYGGMVDERVIILVPVYVQPNQIRHLDPAKANPTFVTKRKRIEADEREQASVKTRARKGPHVKGVGELKPKK